MAATGDLGGAVTAAALTRRTNEGMDPPDEAGFTIDDLHAIPEGRLRYELIEGSLQVTPSATSSHNNVAQWMAAALWAANPGGEFIVSTNQSVTIDDHSELRPDIVVARAAVWDVTPFPASDAILVVEVVSPTSVIRDNETKRAAYARAGVPSYWIVDPTADSDDGKHDAIALVEFALDKPHRSYRYVTHYTTAVFRTETPWPIEIDLPALTERRAQIRRWARGKS